MSTALYRRYRPESFSEMIGQSHVTDPLRTALSSGRIGHAYLFSGPRGCGKTTSARILARCLNCSEGPTETPCGVCPSCIELGRDGGGSLDVIEIDAASHGGVDDARDLRERAVFAPARDRYKIFIVDEAHMVTKEGFNALLKIVEEPPEHVKFIFATTEPEKVIGTIRSRTHHYPFRLVAPATLVEYSAELAKQEGITADEGVLALAVRAGGGSVRDTLSILDQLIAGSVDSHIGYDLAVGFLGYTPGDLLDAVIEALAKRNAEDAISSVNRVIQTGQDPRRFVEDLLERLRDLIVVQATSVAGAASVLQGVSDDQLDRLFKQASSFQLRELSTVADTVSAGLDSMTGATSPQLQLELMFARVLSALNPIQESVAEPTPEPAPTPTPEPAPEPTPQPVPQPAPESVSVENTDIADVLQNARMFLAGEDQIADPPAKIELPFTTEEVQKQWIAIKSALREENLDAASSAEGVSLGEVSGDRLEIVFRDTEALNNFKNHGSGPVRELINNMFQVNVVFVPKRVTSAEPMPEPEPEPAPVFDVPPVPEPELPPAPPKRERRGEAVLREKLGAQFVEEIPNE